MPVHRGERLAFGAPGNAPFWAPGDKCGVGTAYSASSHVWYTLWRGMLTEVYYPTVDRPQTRDLRFLISDNKSFVHDEATDLDPKVERTPHSTAYFVESRARDGSYCLWKEVIASPHLPCVLIHYKFENKGAPLRLYVQCNPHMEGGGAENNAYVVDVAGRTILVAEKGERWLAMGVACRFSRATVGYVGTSDTWADLSDNYQLDWEFDRATSGNVTLAGEIDLSRHPSSVVGLAFGESLHSAVTTLLQALGRPYREQRDRFLNQWKAAENVRLPGMEEASGDGGRLYRSSHRILVAHEDKTFQGAFIASPSVPWGQIREDAFAGYHLVWTRDMVHTAMGLVALGDSETALRALIYLAASQEANGRFPQDFWVDGEVYGRILQSDEVAFPILLARLLHRNDGLRHFDPRTTVYRAASFLVKQGPVTGEERWEETSGYSPSTLAVVIAGLLCAAAFIREEGDEDSARFLEEYADFLRDRLPDWCVTNAGEVVPGITRHFIRLNPVALGNVAKPNSVDTAEIPIPNQPPGKTVMMPARNIVDAGFLWLVRLGIYAPDDPLIIDSLKVTDAALQADTPCGLCWRRYSHDGYGQRPDGGPWDGWGQGRCWPLLTGERGHYELAAGRDATPYLKTMERIAIPTGMLPEQIWDAEDLPEFGLKRGGPTGSAMPLLWAHAEYVRLLRSIRDGVVFDLVPEAAERYLKGVPRSSNLDLWTIRHPIESMRAGRTLRICSQSSFRLRWSLSGWAHTEDVDSRRTAIGIEYVDIPTKPDQREPLQFTAHWTDTDRWEERIETVKLE